MINKKYQHYEQLESFLSKKVSADPGNTTYTLGGMGDVYEGEPDISWKSLVYIKDPGFLWTHGKLYDATGKAESLKTPVKINGVEFDGSGDIITEVWGESRQVTITDGVNTSDIVQVDGGKDITLVLPKSLDLEVTKDSKGRIIADTYSTKQELSDALDELETFFVYSGPDDSYPSLLKPPALEWTTSEEREKHSGDFYVTTEGRVFRFEQNQSSKEWGWREMTDFYLYDCLSELKSVQKKVDISGRWDETQTTVENGKIDIKGEEMDRYYLDVLYCPGYVTYKIQEATDINLYLPFAYGGNWTRTITRYFKNIPRLVKSVDLSRISGKTIIITNNSSERGARINLYLGDSPTQKNQQITLDPGDKKTCILTLQSEMIDGNLVFYWKASEVGRLGLTSGWE